MSDITMKRGDRLPPLEAVLKYSDGSIIDLTGCTVLFLYRQLDSSTTVSRSMTITSAAAGAVKYDWTSSDIPTAGRYRAEFEVTDTNGKQLTIPTRNQLTMIVYDDLA